MSQCLPYSHVSWSCRTHSDPWRWPCGGAIHGVHVWAMLGQRNLSQHRLENRGRLVLMVCEASHVYLVASAWVLSVSNREQHCRVRTPDSTVLFSVTSRHAGLPHRTPDCLLFSRPHVLPHSLTTDSCLATNVESARPVAPQCPHPSQLKPLDRCCESARSTTMHTCSSEP